MPALHTPDTLPATVPSTPTRRTGWAGAALVLVTLTCSIGAIVGAWWLGARPANRPVEHYLPNGAGSGVVYRAVYSSTTSPISTDTTTSGVNYLRRNAAWMLRQSNAVVYTSIAEQLGLGTITADNLIALQRADALYTREVEQAGIGNTQATTVTEANYLIQPNELLLVMERAPALSLAYVPPLPVMRTDLPLNQAHVTTGTVSVIDDAGMAAYTGTLTLEARELLQLGDRHFGDCLRVRNRLQIGTFDTGFSRTWYCAGQGLVRAELYAPDGSLTRAVEQADTNALPSPQAESGAPALSPAEWRKPLTVTWKFDNTDGISAVTARPVVAGDVVLVGTFIGDVVALDRRTGSERWRYHTGGSIFAAPTVAEGVAYIASADRSVHAIDAATGAFRWRFATRDAVVASPVFAHGVVYAGSEDRTLYALDARTGQLLRSFSTGGPVSVAPAVDGNTIYVGSEDGALYALNTSDLSLRWAFAAGNAISCAPLVMDGTVYVGAHNSMVYALKANPTRDDGEVVWQTQLRYPVVERMQTQDLRLFLATSYEVLALDIGTGQTRWRQPAANNYGAPLVLGQRVFMMTSDGVSQFDADTGQPVAVVELSADAKHAGLGSDGAAIYAGYSGGDVYALRPQ